MIAVDLRHRDGYGHVIQRLYRAHEDGVSQIAESFTGPAATGQRRILYVHNLGPPGIDLHPLATGQITCSPRFADARSDGRVISLNAPVGSFDISVLVNRLPEDQRPDVLVAYIDCTQRCLPRNTRSLGIPRAVFVSDVHHGVKPLENVLSYLVAEQYDDHFLVASRQAARWLRGAGLKDVFFGGPNVLARPYDGPFRRSRQPVIGFVGQTGDLHPRRRRLIQSMLSAGLPLSGGLMPQPHVTNFLSDVLIGFNCSLNGDISMRVFEVISAGALLITDRLCSESGIDLLLDEGRHFIAYDGEADLLEKARYYLSHPDEAIAIAEAGFRHFHGRLRPEDRASQILDAILKRKTDRSLSVSEQRPIRSGGVFWDRVRCYEALQEIHRIAEAPRVFFTSGARDYAEDAADLVRLTAVVQRDGSPLDVGEGGWDAVVATESVLQARSLSRHNLIIVPDTN